MPDLDTNIPDEIHDAAVREMSQIARLAVQKVCSNAEAERVAQKLGYKSGRTVYRKIQRYLQAPYLTTFLPRKYHPCKSQRQSRIPAETERLMQQAIEKYFLGRKEAMPERRLLQLINRACRRAGASIVSASSLHRRILALPRKSKALAKKFKTPPCELDAAPGRLISEVPLEYVQMDHTVTDAFLDLQEFGLNKRRPWLTLVIDLATRGILGYYISLSHPNARSNAVTILIGCTDKHVVLERAGLSLKPFEDAGISDPWFLTGRPLNLCVDNAYDLAKGPFARGCSHLGINVITRPIGTPHFGGHIERLIGCFMRDVHMLPGTSFDNVKAREGYDAERHACMTLDEFETWLLMNIMRYHLEPHAGLGCSPYQRFQDLKGNTPSLLLQPDLIEVQRAFLERETRIITKRGIRLKNRFYFCDRLAPYIGQKVLVGFQCNDLSRVQVSLDYRLDHLEVPLLPYENQCRNLEAWEGAQQAKRLRHQDERLTRLTEELTHAMECHVDASRRRGRGQRRTEPQKITSRPHANATLRLASAKLIKPLERRPNNGF